MRRVVFSNIPFLPYFLKNEMTTSPQPTLSLTATPTMKLEPEKWALEAQKLAAEYEGLPEATYFLTTARRFKALSAALPVTVPDEDLDGMVVLGDID